MPIDFSGIAQQAFDTYSAKGGQADTLQGGNAGFLKDFAQKQFSTVTATPTAQKPTKQIAEEFLTKTATSMAAGEQDLQGAIKSGFALAGSLAAAAGCAAIAIPPVICAPLGSLLGGLLGSWVAGLFGPGGPQQGFCQFCNDIYANSGNNSQAGFRNGACNVSASVLGSCETFKQLIFMQIHLLRDGDNGPANSPERIPFYWKRQSYMVGAPQVWDEAVYDMIVRGAETGATGQKGDLINIVYCAKVLAGWYGGEGVWGPTNYAIARQYPKALAYLCFAANGITDGNEVRRWVQAYDFAAELNPLLIAQNYGTVVMANGSIPPGIQAYIDAENKKNAIYKGLAAGFGAASLGLGINFVRQNLK